MSKYAWIVILALVAALWLTRPAVARNPLERPVVSQLAFSPDGQRLIASYFVSATNRPGTNWRAWGGEWDLKTGKGLLIPGAVGPMAFAPDGQTIAMGIGERRKTGSRQWPEVRLALWQFGQREPSKVLSAGDGELPAKHAVSEKVAENVVAAAFQSDGKQVASVSGRGLVLLWPIGEENKPSEIVNLDERLEHFRWGGIPATASLAFDKDSTTLTLSAITIDRKHPDVTLRTTWQIDLATKQFQRTEAKDTSPPPAENDAAAVAHKTKGPTWPSPDGKRLANADDAGSIQIVDRDSGEIVQTLSIENLEK